MYSYITVVQVLILQACQNMPRTDIQLPEVELDGQDILDEEIARHMNSKLMRTTSKRDLQIVQDRHSKPSNVDVPESCYSSSQREHTQQHLEVQKSVLKSLYALGAVGNKIVNRDLSEWREPVKDAITLMTQASHQLRSQSGNKT